MWKQDPKCSHLHEPNFLEDPSEWFDWFDDCASGVPDEPTERPEPPCTPSTWTDAEGRCWEMVCAPNGPDIRPCFDRPLPPRPDQIVALRLTGNGYFAQIATKRGLIVRKLANREARLGQLASAMLNQSKLPTTDIGKIPAAFWAKQKKIVVKRPHRKN